MLDSTLTMMQWPAMAITLIAAWLIASQTKQRRQSGFWLFLLSNILWIIWGWHDDAYALILLQLGLIFLNWRGAKKNEPLENSSQATQQY